MLTKLLGNRKYEFYFLTAASALISGTEALLHPLLVKTILDQATLYKNFQTFIWLVLFYLIFGLALNIASHFTSKWQKSFENKALLNIENKLIESSIQQEWSIYSSNGSAFYISRIHRDALDGLIPSVQLSIDLSKLIVSMVAFIAVLIYLSWKASLVLLIILPFLVYISKSLSKKVKETTEGEREAEAVYLNYLGQTLNAYRALRGMPRLLSLGQVSSIDKLQKYLDFSYANFKVMNLQKTWSSIFMNFSDTLSMGVGGYLVFTSQLTLGGFLAFTNSLWRAVNSMFAISQLYPKYIRNQAVIERINELCMISDNQHVVKSEGSEIRFNDILYAYSDEENLKIPDFEILKGERVLIQGKNGSGKSSLIHIISGYLLPKSGILTNNGKISSVTLPINLPPTLVENLVPDERLRHELDIESLKLQMPGRLSAGQQQKVAIGAALSEEADVYIFDEPLANLDSQSKEIILNLIDRRTIGKTLIIVEHNVENISIKFSKSIIIESSRTEKRTQKLIESRL